MPKETVIPAGLQRLGPYVLSDVLGRGGMGTVYRGTEGEGGREVAVKVLSPAFAAEEGFRSRFESEIQSLKKLRHPNIVALYGYGEQDGHLFYAMELVNGSSLHEELAAGRRFHWREVVRLGLDMCAALRHAHDHGVIHRDIKPANLLLGDDERLKLTDFGIAKLFGQTSLTMVGGIVGTADYMAPEQAQGRPVTPRTDLYSAGCALYALLTGRPPFEGSSVTAVIQKVQFDAPIPLGRIVKDIPESLEQLIDRLLSKAPEDRIPTALAVSKQLEAIERQMQLPANPPSDSEGLTTVEGTLVTPDELSAAPLPDEPTGADTPTVALPREHYAGSDAPHESPTWVQTEDGEGIAIAHAPGRFVPVGEPEPIKDTRMDVWRGRLGVLLTSGLCVLLLGLAVRLLIAPPNADALYGRIARAAEAGPDELSAEKASIGLFLQQHATDPRADQVRAWQQEIELERLQNSIERSLRRHTDPRRATAVQSALASAIRVERTDPQRAVTILKGMLLAYGEAPDLGNRDRQCLELARRKIAELEQGFDSTYQRELQRLQQRFDEAQALPAAEAIPVLRGLEMIHADDPWAAPLVEQIRQARAKFESPQP